jgi:hypothetical protein
MYIAHFELDKKEPIKMYFEANKEGPKNMNFAARQVSPIIFRVSSNMDLEVEND